jgi:hypothetical protein
MTIETKYNVGDEVWSFGFFGEPQKGTIQGITAFLNEDCTGYRTVCYGIYNIGTRTQEYVFSTKEELLNSL